VARYCSLSVDLLTLILGKRKRIPSDTGNEDAKRRKKVRDQPSITPSSAKTKDITRRKDIFSYNRPKASCATIPLALLHPVFADFLEACQHHQPTEEDNKWLMGLRQDMLQEYRNENERCTQFRQTFEEHTGIAIPDASIPGTQYSTDGHYAIGEHFLLITAGKNEWARMSSDPPVQAFTYYNKSVNRIEKLDYLNDVFKNSPLPCLIIYYVGEYVILSGI
jgi:hypothetical protein